MDARRRRSGIGLAAAAACGFLALALLALAIGQFWEALHLPKKSTSFALQVPQGQKMEPFRSPLVARAESMGPVAIDGARENLILIRIQSTKTRILRPLVTMRGTEKAPPQDLSPSEAAEVSRLVSAHPLPAALVILDESEAPAVRDVSVLHRRGLGGICLAAAVVILAMVALTRGAARRS